MPPVLINDRARKVFDLFIPGLDKDVDMASDLGKAMFRVNCAPSGSVFASLRRDTRDDPGLLLGTRKHTPSRSA
jgi:hypothetical protein